MAKTDEVIVPEKTVKELTGLVSLFMTLDNAEYYDNENERMDALAGIVVSAYKMGLSMGICIGRSAAYGK